MRFLKHFLLSNIRYNKIELSISYGLTSLVFVGFVASKGTSFAFGEETLISIAFYALLYAFFSNKKKLNLKYLVSLPLSKAQLLVTKSAADIVFFIPAMALAFVGLKQGRPELNSFALLVMFCQISVLVSFFLFDSDVEQPRLENTRASFVNRLVYLRKMLNMGFLSMIGGLLALGIFALPVSIWSKQYLLIVLFGFALALKFRRSLKLMQDESLSYFIFKRDLWAMALKMGAVASPALFAMFMGAGALKTSPELFSFIPSPYGKHRIFNLVQGDKSRLEEFLNKEGETLLSVTGENGYTPVLAAITLGKEDAFNLLVKKGFSLSWDMKVTDEKRKRLGHGPVHLAAFSNNVSIMRKVLEATGRGVDEVASDSLDTPLIVAARSCKNEMVDYLLEEGANTNLQNAKGETALMASVKKGCDTATAMLLERGASTSLKNDEGKIALDLMSPKDSMYYYLKKKTPESALASRALASKSD